ncbi:MAG: Ku protein [Acidobacteria bacterium]|nr:Ku protein [Acidobacteriota bacterium]
MAPRAIWTGSISFGLVNVPIRLLAATESKDVHFHQFEAKTRKRIHNKRVAEGSNREVSFDRVIKGYETSKGRYVMVEPAELESVEPGQSRTIEIEDFIDLHEVDPIYFEHAYYLTPDTGRGADRPYALLRDAMARTEKVAIGRFVMRTKQYLACIRPVDRVLVLETMYFHDEIRDPKALDVPGKVKFSPKELQTAGRLIDSLTTPWDPRRYKDTYRARVLKLIRAKGQGKEIEVAERKQPERVADLMAALEASVAASRKKTTKRTPSSSHTRRKAS